MAHIDPQTAQLIFAGVAAIALLLQALVLLAIFFGVKKAVSALRTDFDEMRSSVTPFVKEVRETFERVAPKIEQTTADVAALTQTLRAQSDDLKATSTEIIQKTRRQAERIDSMTTSVLDAADRAGTFVNDAVTRPVRQITGIVASIKAVVETLRAPDFASRPRATRPPADTE